MKNPIEEFLRKDGEKLSKHSELFKGNDDFIDQMSEVSERELRQILSLQMIDDYLSRKGIKPPFKFYTHKFLRLQVSKDRQSRKEFVDVNRAEKDPSPTNVNLGLGGALP